LSCSLSLLTVDVDVSHGSLVAALLLPTPQTDTSHVRNGATDADVASRCVPCTHRRDRCRRAKPTRSLHTIDAESTKTKHSSRSTSSTRQGLRQETSRRSPRAPHAITGREPGHLSDPESLRASERGRTPAETRQLQQRLGHHNGVAYSLEHHDWQLQQYLSASRRQRRQKRRTCAETTGALCAPRRLVSSPAPFLHAASEINRSALRSTETRLPDRPL
jgi:transposase